MQFLEEPQVTFDKEDGRVVSAYIKLREGIKAVGSIQPNESVLVFFLIAEDGLPIGIRLHEPASGLAVCELIDKLIEGPDGPAGVSREIRHDFLSLDDLQAVVRGVRRSLQELTE